MNTPQVLALAGVDHDRLKRHLFPGDGLEAAAILLCSRSAPPRVRLLVRDIVFIPYEACEERQPDHIAWPGEYLEEALDRAEAQDFTVILAHSHPGGLFAFSHADDESDQQSVKSLLANHGQFHGSAIMVPSGAMRARYYTGSMLPQAIQLVTVAGHELCYWWDEDATPMGPAERPLAFTGAMTRELGKLTAMVVGVSGTGSVCAEQLCRMGFKKVLLVDFDIMKLKNLNRILNSTIDDVERERLKVEMFANAVERYRGPGVAVPLNGAISERDKVITAGQSDMLFCCTDSLESRHIVDLIAQAYLMPLFDVGVVIPTRKNRQSKTVIDDALGRLDYIQPGRSTLSDRGVYTPATLRAEYLEMNAPEAHRQQAAAGYIPGIMEEAPAVISLNMRAAADCVMEFLARAYPFRHGPNEGYARTLFSLAACEVEYVPESSFTSTVDSNLLARGSREPLLGLPALSPPTKGSE